MTKNTKFNDIKLAMRGGTLRKFNFKRKENI
jgi:hypothetical protein